MPGTQLARGEGGVGARQGLHAARHTLLGPLMGCSGRPAGSCVLALRAKPFAAAGA